MAEKPEQHGISNVYADLGQAFVSTMSSQPQLCAAMLDILVKGLGPDRVCWGTEAILRIGRGGNRRQRFPPYGSAVPSEM